MSQTLSESSINDSSVTLLSQTVNDIMTVASIWVANNSRFILCFFDIIKFCRFSEFSFLICKKTLLYPNKKIVSRVVKNEVSCIFVPINNKNDFVFLYVSLLRFFSSDLFDIALSLNQAFDFRLFLMKHPLSILWRTSDQF